MLSAGLRGRSSFATFKLNKAGVETDFKGRQTWDEHIWVALTLSSKLCMGAAI